MSLPDKNDLARTFLSGTVVLGVLGAVTVLIVVGGLTPVVAVGTTTTASYVAVEAVRRLLGMRPTRLGLAIEAAVQAVLTPTPVDRPTEITPGERGDDAAA